MSDLAGWELTTAMVTTSWAPGAAATWPALVTADHSDDLTHGAAVMRSTAGLSFINPVLFNCLFWLPGPET